MNKRFVHFVHT